jgi:hypothetical protein
MDRSIGAQEDAAGQYSGEKNAADLKYDRYAQHFRAPTATSGPVKRHEKRRPKNSKSIYLSDDSFESELRRLFGLLSIRRG